MSPTLRRLVAIGAAVAALVVASIALDRTRREIDLTQDRALTMTRQTRDLVDALRRDVKITAYIPRQEAGRAEASALLARYQRLNPRISFELEDPNDVPGEASNLGIDLVAGGVVLESGDKRELAASASELEITAALARLQRDGDATVCFTAGHGERGAADSTDAGYDSVGKALRTNGYVVESIDLLTASAIPESCEALILAAPTAALGDREQLLVDWIAADGRALVLADPESTVDLNPLVEPMGVHIERGIVFEGSDQARLPRDPLTPVVSTYRSGYPFVQRLAPTFYPGAQAVSVARDPNSVSEGLIVATFAQTSELAYLERQPATPSFSPDEDIAGPVGLGAAADRSRVEGVDVRRSRVAVIGDVDFASNAFVDDGGGNVALVVRIADWLTVQENLVAISPNVARLRPLPLTEARSRYALILSAGIVPLLFLVAGALVWAVRRGR